MADTQKNDNLQDKYYKYIIMQQHNRHLTKYLLIISNMKPVENKMGVLRRCHSSYASYNMSCVVWCSKMLRVPQDMCILSSHKNNAFNGGKNSPVISTIVLQFYWFILPQIRKPLYRDVNFLSKNVKNTHYISYIGNLIMNYLDVNQSILC